MGRYLVDWVAAQGYHDRGHDRDACMARFGFRIAAWYRAIRFGRLRAEVRRGAVDWSAVQRFYDEGRGYRECQGRFGFAGASWTKAVRRGALKSRGNAKPLDQLLATSRSRSSIKRRLLLAGILENRCDECGLTEWRGRP